jgi:hypothetical protein
MPDTSRGDLVLRISGPSHEGQIVRLKSAKCTIGSGHNCTLRLRACGVAPVHCLLLRGRKGTVARCWSADTRLNDRSFTDALLSSGDRLSIGPIELEVMGLGAAPLEREQKIEPEEKQCEVDERNKNLTARLTELDAERNALTTERTDLETQRNALLAERDDLKSQQSALEAERKKLEARRNAFAAEQDGLEVRINALVEERRQWIIGQQDALQKIDDQRGQLIARLAEYDAERIALAAERKELKAQQEAIAEERRQRPAQQDETLHEIDDQRRQLASRFAELEAERQSLAAERSGLETQRNALAEERRQWQAAQEAVKHDGDKQGEQLAARLAELEAERQSLAAERDGLETQRNALAEERSQWQAAREAVKHDGDKQGEQLAARLAEFEADRQYPTVNRGSMELQRNALAKEDSQPVGKRAEPSEPENEAAEPVAEKEALSPASETAELQFQEPTERAPVDLNEVFRRVGAKIDLQEEEQAPAASAGNKGGSSIFADAKNATVHSKTGAVRDEAPPAKSIPHEPAVSNPPTRVSAVSAVSATGTTDEGNEESIDEYMNKLMQRVRAGSGEPRNSSHTTQRTDPIRTPREAAANAAASMPSEPQPSSSTAASEENEPESVPSHPRAPAKPINLEALREVANISAKSAIAQHARRTLIHTMYGKLIVAVVALGAGVGLYWMWKEYGACEMTLYSSLLAIAMALLSGLEYAYLTGRLIIGKKGRNNINRHSSSQRASAALPATDNAANHPGGDPSTPASIRTGGAGSPFDTPS